MHADGLVIGHRRQHGSGEGGGRLVVPLPRIHTVSLTYQQRSPSTCTHRRPHTHTAAALIPRLGCCAVAGRRACTLHPATGAVTPTRTTGSVRYQTPARRRAGGAHTLPQSACPRHARWRDAGPRGSTANPCAHGPPATSHSVTSRVSGATRTTGRVGQGVGCTHGRCGGQHTHSGRTGVRGQTRGRSGGAGGDRSPCTRTLITQPRRHPPPTHPRVQRRPSCHPQGSSHSQPSHAPAMWLARDHRHRLHMSRPQSASVRSTGAACCTRSPHAGNKQAGGRHSPASPLHTHTPTPCTLAGRSGPAGGHLAALAVLCDGDSQRLHSIADGGGVAVAVLCGSRCPRFVTTEMRCTGARTRTGGTPAA